MDASPLCEARIEAAGLAVEACAPHIVPEGWVVEPQSAGCNGRPVPSRRHGRWRAAVRTRDFALARRW